MLFETLSEIAWAGKAGAISDFFDARNVVAAEYSERFGQARVTQGLVDTNADVLFEKSIEMSGGDAGVLGDLIKIDGTLEIGVDKGVRSSAEGIPVVALVEADRGRQHERGKVKASRQNLR